MDKRCFKCKQTGHISKNCEQATVSNKKDISIIEDDLEISIKFVKVNTTPILQVQILKNKQLKSNRTFYKEDWSNHSDKKVIIVEGIYTIRLQFSTTDRTDKLSIHGSRDHLYLFSETYNI